MTPSPAKVQCPWCLGWRGTKADGTMYLHDWGRPGMRKRCPGAGKTKEDAKAAKLAGDRDSTVPSGRPDEVRPEDIF